MRAAFRPQLLVVDDIWLDPENEAVLTAQIRVGGHPNRVVLDFARVSSGLVRYVQIPWMLGVHAPSQKAVVNLMTCFHDGEPVTLPANLSDALAAADPPSPFLADPAEDVRLPRDSASIRVDLAEVSRSGNYPALFRGVARIGGEPLELEAEVYAGPGRVPVLRWIRTSRALTPAESDAIQRQMVREIESACGEA